jgi:hypothetical protein
MRKLIRVKTRIKVAILFLGLIIFSTSCEDDFTTIGSDFVNSLDLPEPYVVQDLSSYSDNILSVQSNTLNTYLLGEFDDPIFGNTNVSILSQLQLQTTNPDFGEEPQVDSVILTLPIFGQVIDNDEETGKDIYRLDSIFGSGSFKIGVYESNQFLRDIDPGDEGDFEESQLYYSNQLSEIESNIITSDPLTVTEVDGVLVPSDFSQTISPSDLDRTVVLIDRTDTIESANEEDGTEDVFERIRLSPRIRIKLDPDFFQEKILNQGNSINLISQSSFENYFRSLYLVAEQEAADGSKFMVNLSLANQEANITLYYNSLRPPPSLEVVENPELELTFNEFVMNFGGNVINFYETPNSIDLSNQDIENGEENIFLKGGQGVVAIVDPFNGPDADGNGVADEIDTLRTKNWLINEANLILYVDQDLMSEVPFEKQPFRIFAYDLDRDRVLIDYNLDQSSSNNPFTSKLNHLGPLRQDENGDYFYKIRMTSHINNIINNDSINTRIGIVVTQNVNQARILDVKESELDQAQSFIESTISTPRGTVLHGNLSDDEDKRLKLQIYYTDPNN